MGIQFLDWLYDLRSRQPNRMVFLIEYFGGEEPDDNADQVWRYVLRRLQCEGLIALAETSQFAGTSVMIVRGGVQAVRSRRQRRQEAAFRTAAAQDAVLRWVSSHPGMPDLSPMLVDPDSFFEGQPFTLRDLERASGYLADVGLIQGVTSESGAVWFAVSTVNGTDCLERDDGSVSAYRRRVADGVPRRLS